MAMQVAKREPAPSLLVTREVREHANVFHTLTDLLNVYISLRMLGREHLSRWESSKPVHLALTTCLTVFHVSDVLLQRDKICVIVLRFAAQAGRSLHTRPALSGLICSCPCQQAHASTAETQLQLLMQFTALCISLRFLTLCSFHVSCGLVRYLTSQ